MCHVPYEIHGSSVDCYGCVRRMDPLYTATCSSGTSERLCTEQCALVGIVVRHAALGLGAWVGRFTGGTEG